MRDRERETEREEKSEVAAVRMRHRCTHTWCTRNAQIKITNFEPQDLCLMPHTHTHSTIPHPVVVVALSSALRLLSSKFDLYVQVCLRLCHAHTLKIVAQSAFEPETAQQGRREQGRTGQDRTRQGRTGQAKQDVGRQAGGSSRALPCLVRTVASVSY